MIMKKKDKKMLDGWREVRLGDIADIVTGKTPPTKRKELFGDRYPFITPTDIGMDSVFCNSARKLSEEGGRYQKNLILPKNTVCYTCIASIGKICITEENSFTNQQINALKAHEEKMDYKFLFYKLKSITPYIENIAGGTTAKIINKSKFEDIEITIPPLKEQKAIADVLGSLDDKIELLRGQNGTLEEIGQVLFRKWFVEDADEGWEKGKVSDLVTILSGFPFKSSFYKKEGEYRLITIKNVQDGYLDLGRTDYLSDIPEKMPDYCLLSKGDILLSLTGNVGRCCLVTEDNLLLNQRVAKLQSKEEQNIPFVYFFFRQPSVRKKLEDMASGSTAQANLSPIQTADMEISIPPSKVLQKFFDVGDSLIQKILLNNTQIKTLEELRDLLLPKLISGEVRVKI